MTPITATALLAACTLAACSSAKPIGVPKVKVAKATIMAIEDAANHFYEANQRFPESLEMLVIPDSQGAKFLESDVMPKDPWGNDFVLQMDGDAILIWTYGADKQKGGAGTGRDFNNRMIANKEI